MWCIIKQTQTNTIKFVGGCLRKILNWCDLYLLQKVILDNPIV